MEILKSNDLMDFDQFAEVFYTEKMKRTVTFFLIFAISSNVISGAALSGQRLWKKKLREKYCEYEHLNPYYSGDIIDLISLDAKPIGFNVKLQYSSIGLRNTGIAFSATQIASNFFDDEVSRYNIDFDLTGNITLTRYPNRNRLYEVELPIVNITDVLMDLCIAITDDGTITVSVEGNTVLSYHDPKPFPSINYFRFASISFERDGNFYYNCIARTDNIETKSLVADLDEQRQANTKLNKELIETSTAIWIYIIIISIIFGILTVVQSFTLYKLGLFKRENSKRQRDWERQNETVFCYSKDDNE